MGDVTQILKAIDERDPALADELLPLVSLVSSKGVLASRQNTFFTTFLGTQTETDSLRLQ
jgi:hypothetical protein